MHRVLDIDSSFLFYSNKAVSVLQVKILLMQATHALRLQKVSSDAACQLSFTVQENARAQLEHRLSR